LADGSKIPPAIDGVEMRLDKIIDLLTEQTTGGRAERPSPDVQPQEIEIREPAKSRPRPKPRTAKGKRS